MNAKRVNAAAGVIHASQVAGRQTAAGFAADLESACLLQSPESAVEQERLRSQATDAMSDAELLRQQAEVLRARVAELEAGRAAVLDDFIARCEVALSGCCSECDAAVAIVRGRKQAALDNAAVPEWSTDQLTRLLASTQALREDDPFHLHHAYRVGRDLPEMGGAR